MLAVTVFAGCTASEAKNIRRRWNLEVPYGMKTAYHKDTFGWFGDGMSYTVLVSAGEPMTTERFTAFCEGELAGCAYRSDGAYCARLEEEAETTVRRLEVPAEYAPDFARGYWYSLGGYEPHDEGDFSVDGVLFLWLEEENRLLVFEGRT